MFLLTINVLVFLLLVSKKKHLFFKFRIVQAFQSADSGPINLPENGGFNLIGNKIGKMGHQGANCYETKASPTGAGGAGGGEGKCFIWFLVK